MQSVNNGLQKGAVTFSKTEKVQKNKKLFQMKQKL